MPEQILYKYRSLNNWKFLIDIILGNRLYASSFRALNDPMEGRYHYAKDDVSKAFDRAIRESKDYWRICSLSTKPTSTLMWSYYADGHTGVTLGVTVPKRRLQKVMSVRYDSDVSIDPRHYRRPARDVALDILSQKQWGWSHECEVRVFSNESFVPVEVKSVLLGCQMPPADRGLVRDLIRSVNPKVQVKQLQRSHLDAPLELIGNRGSRGVA